MTIPLHTKCLAIGLLMQALSSAPLPAQDTARTPAVTPHAPKQCWRGQPKPACDEFLITEVGFFYRALRPSRVAMIPGGNGYLPHTQKRQAASRFLAAEVGGMRNAGQQSALGLTLSFAGENGGIGNGFDATFGAKARYRRWLDWHGTSIELAAGIESRPDPYDDTRRRGAGLTSEVAVNANDHIALVLRYDQLRFEGKRKPSLSFGFRPGAQTGFFTGAAIGVSVLLASLVVSSFADF